MNPDPTRDAHRPRAETRRPGELWTALALLLAAGIVLAAAAEFSSPAGSAPASAVQFLEDYQREFAVLERTAALASWKAANSGKPEDYDAYAAAALALEDLHADAARYRQLMHFLAAPGQLPPLIKRALQIARLRFEANQLPRWLVKRQIELSAEIEKIFHSYRAELRGQQYSDNELLEMLGQAWNGDRRREIWTALKAVGGEVAPKLVELVGLRNEGARLLGYADYWRMAVTLQELDPDWLGQIFTDLARLTQEPFDRMKAELDAELARRFQLAPAELRPWHYDDPFFQDAPPAEALDLDEFYRGKPREEIIELARRFFASLGLPIDDIIARSDYYDREGKDQGGFCLSVDRALDVRTLLNVTPSLYWMDTMLHESGHAVYYKFMDHSLPYLLRDSDSFTTEGIAMLFGALAKNPRWLVQYAGAAPRRVRELEPAIIEQRRREQLIFARWTLVMVFFERELYAHPDGDLTARWQELVERFQGLKSVPGRDAPDWAAKPHFTIAPVYYHGYMLGEMFAAQVRARLMDLAGHAGSAATLDWQNRRDFGAFLTKNIFQPGLAQRWEDLVVQATGDPLGPGAFAEELAAR